MKYTIVCFLILTLSQAQIFEVQNVTASQRTDGSHILDVCYDLSPDDLFISFRVTAEINIDGSEDNWMYLSLPVIENVYGDNVLPGENKCFTVSLDDYFTNTYSSTTQIRVNAEGHEALELPFEMVMVTEGEFMGAHLEYHSAYSEDELANINYSYEIMKYEVTNAQYVTFLIELLENDELVQCGQSNNPSGYCVYYPGETFTDLYGQVSESNHIYEYSPGYYSPLKMGEQDNNSNTSACRIYWNGITFIIEEGYGNHPVVSVSYMGAWAFANYYGLRLPNLNEWLKAARGPNSWLWAFDADDNWNQDDYNRANTSNGSDPWSDLSGMFRSTPIGFYNGLDNEWGYETIDSPSYYVTYDQTGNVREWIAQLRNGDSFITGGHSFETGGSTARLNYWVSQQPYDPYWGYGPTGFRCVRTINNSSE